jgi:DNA end-binding protein Ku
MEATIWIGSIRLAGSVIPVKLHTAVREESVGFHLLHKTDRVQLHQLMVCALESAPVPRQEQVKGFKLEERKYVLIDPEELEAAEPEESRDINVREFIKSGEIDPVFIERTYYLEPDSSVKSYNALAAALDETKTEAVCTWVMRKRSYLGSLRHAGRTLRLGILRYADEVIKAQSLSLENFPLSEKELSIGAELINKLSVAFNPEQYVNEHQKKLQALIEKKARGEKISLLKPKIMKTTPPGKLLDALKRSLKKAA